LTLLLYSFSLCLLLSKTFQSGFAFRLFLGPHLIELGLALVLFTFLYRFFTGDPLRTTRLILWESALSLASYHFTYLCFALL
jgi:hypothetical protein